MHRSRVPAELSGVPTRATAVLRPVRQYLTHAKPTGYDRAGQLCAALSPAEKLMRAELVVEKEEFQTAAETACGKTLGNTLR